MSLNFESLQFIDISEVPKKHDSGYAQIFDKIPEGKAVEFEWTNKLQTGFYTAKSRGGEKYKNILIVKRGAKLFVAKTLSCAQKVKGDKE